MNLRSGICLAAGLNAAVCARHSVERVYESVLQLLKEAQAAGFEISIGSALTPIGKHMITALRVAKIY
jgi:hypothetical protein